MSIKPEIVNQEVKIKFLGVGGAFASISKGQSNMLIESNGKKLLVDCGMTAPYIIRDELGIKATDIDAVYISHLHADHIGGMEWLAFSTYFMKGERPKLFCEQNLMHELWESSLKGGLESLEGKIANLTTYFDCKPFIANTTFNWEGIRFRPVQTIHVVSGYKFQYSFGLILSNEYNEHFFPDVFITTDTQFCPSQLNYFYSLVKTVFHDCETLPFRSGVHAHYDDLKTLPLDHKNKMWLYHYADKKESVIDDGFAGFVEKGQEFIFNFTAQKPMKGDIDSWPLK